jgi:hypothetical protein
MNIYQIDRFEGGLAVLVDIESGGVRALAPGALPFGAKELDILVFENGRYTMDYKKTEELKRRARDLYARAAQ